MSKSLLKKSLSEKKSRIEWKTEQDHWNGFLDVSEAYIWFLVEVNAFQTGKSSVQVRAAP